MVCGFYVSQAALEYILRLLISTPEMPGKSDFQSSVSFQVAAERLLLDSRQYSVLAGDIGSDGYRTPSGALDNYLPQEEVSSLYTIVLLCCVIVKPDFRHDLFFLLGEALVAECSCNGRIKRYAC